MILNPIRAVRCAVIRRQLDRNLAARKTARLQGKVLVRGHTRRLT